MFHKILEWVYGPPLPRVLTRMDVALYATGPMPVERLKEFLGRTVHHVYEEITARGVTFLPRKYRACARKTIAFLDQNPRINFVWVGNEETRARHLACAENVRGIQIGSRSVGYLFDLRLVADYENAEQRFKRYVFAALVQIATETDDATAEAIAGHYFP